MINHIYQKTIIEYLDNISLNSELNDMDIISSKPDCITTIFLSRTKIFYNNSNKLQIELLYALVNIAIGLEYMENIWFQGCMNPLN